ncbi:hypothetical protein, partial [Streptomyces brasiliscabiei]|uniref:hypothetical protein n=1 Tax=Streptomyces brasiliscabiei TaxID=2736302 RepID=UPI0030146EA2
AALVTFSLLRERAEPGAGAAGVAESFRRLRGTLAESRRYRDFAWLLVSGLCYHGGVAVAITLAAIYAEQVIGFKSSETMVLVFV